MRRDQELRSEEVQDILTRTPSWMIIWGNTIILCLIVLFFAFAWFIKYPEVISAEAIVTAQNPPQKISANISGKIDTVLVRNGQHVYKGEILAVLENSANWKDIIDLKKILDTMQLKQNTLNFPIGKIAPQYLGEISTHYAIFEKEYIEYAINKKLDPFFNRIISNELSDSVVQMRFKDSNFHKQIEEKKLKLAENTRIYKNLILSIANLREAIEEWEIKYILKSNVKGNVSSVRILNKGQIVNQGELLFSVFSTSPNHYFAKIKAPIQNSGKIKIGQMVKVKLLKYPETEYGVLNGKIESISPIPDIGKSFYLVEVPLDSSLTTTYNIKLPFKNEMSGTADIITEDLRLLDRFFYQLRKVF
jgi:multidrug efflux pump subunit AcrA (membrane-fusion protein)